MADSVGLNRRTGQVLTDWAHVVQSIEDILTTRVGTRVLRRQYGSDVPGLIDAPMTDASLLAFYVAAATALALWEPRFSLREIAFTAAGQDGKASLRLTGIYIPRGHKGDMTPAGASARTLLLKPIGTSWSQSA
jgi:hypothetical protein